MIRFVLASVLLAPVCLAAAEPASAKDVRLITRAYNSEEVVRIEGRVGVQASVVFAQDEHIENVAVGDSTSWQITPNKRANILFVKPLSARARTNMTVVTDRHTYLFDLHASADTSPLYVLRFTYADDASRLGAQVPGGSSAARPVNPTALNFAWKASGKDKLLPSRVYDDGVSTYLSWAPGVSMPAILIRNEQGAEGPVNFAVQDGLIVLDSVPGLIILRSGRNSATLEFKGEPPRTRPGAALAQQAAAKGK